MAAMFDSAGMLVANWYERPGGLTEEAGAGRNDGDSFPHRCANKASKLRNMQVHEMKSNRSGRRFDIGAMLAEREAERYALHTQHLNEMMVRVVQTLGFDVGFC